MRLSVVMPLAPGEDAWRTLLPQLAALPAGSEIVLVAPCGETVDAVTPRQDLSLRVITAPRGRACQLNAGAAAARGRWLWLLHADSRLSTAVLPTLAGFIARDEDLLGFFDLRFDGDGPALTRLNALGANLRARWLGLPFGDQGFVLRAATLRRLGGFDECVPSGEDHRLVWQARAAGLPLRRLPAALSTSARQYHRRGWLATTTQHLWLTVQQARAARRALMAGR